MKTLISKIYYINLDKRVDRKEFMENQLQSFDIPYERFPAVLVERDELLNKDGKYHDVYTRFLHDHDYTKISSSNKNFRHYRGSIGAYISVFSLVEKLAKENHKENVLILQDDCVLKGGWYDVLESFVDTKELPKDFDVLRCVWSQKNRTYVKKIENNHIFSKCKKTTSLFGGAHFTLVNGKSMGKLYEYLKTSFVYQIDALLWTTQLNVYHAKFSGKVDYLSGHISDCDPKLEH